MSKHSLTGQEPIIADEETKKDEETAVLTGQEAMSSAGEEAKEATGAGDSQPQVTPEERIALLEAEVAELKDQYLRKAADFENFRKRMNREKQEAIDFANQTLLLDLVQTIDDFERAIKSAETSKDFNSFYEGIGMIQKLLLSQLENKWGLKRYDSAGKAFDPQLHEAILMEKSPNVSEPVVAEDFIKGYILKDRVIRHAKVKVTMPENPKAESESPGS